MKIWKDKKTHFPGQTRQYFKFRYGRSSKFKLKLMLKILVTIQYVLTLAEKVQRKTEDIRNRDISHTQ